MIFVKIHFHMQYLYLYIYIAFFLQKFQMPQKNSICADYQSSFDETAVMFNFKPEQFEYFFSASNGILYSFSDLKPSGFFDLPNIAGGNNFHQINRRNLLILPRRRLGGGKPLCDTRFLSLYPTISFHLGFLNLLFK